MGFELPQAVSTNDCAQCSYQAEWPFQLAHHFRKCRRKVNTEELFLELFHALAEPQLYLCFRCGFQSFYRLHRYKHCISRHGVKHCSIQKVFKQFAKYSCKYCQHEGYCSLSSIKHGSCKTKPKYPIECVTITPAMPSVESKTAAIKHFQCRHCSYQCKSNSNLKKHVIVEHATAEEIEWFNCTQCSYRAKLREHLKRHLLTAHAAADINWSSCSECSYRTRLNKDLDKHMLTHAADDEIVWFHCSQCPYRAKHKGHLKRHFKLKHAAASDIGWFSCVHCSYRAKPLDFFLWGYVKSKVYVNKPATIEQLEANISRVIREIPVDMLERVVQNWNSRMDLLRRSNGQHLKEIIFKK